MIICGIEIKSSEAIVALIVHDDGNINYKCIETKKIVLENHECNNSVVSFHRTMKSFVRDNHIDYIAIKKRPMKGKYTGGPVSFKIEGLIQMIPDISIELIPPQTISAFNKKYKYQIPVNLNQYQEQAYYTACYVAHRSK